ncbi:MAG TPA: LacI family DNA-binding transcriptional regulator [Egibacteraceae bacterium]
MARAVRLADVASRAGVSLATASRVLNGSDRTVGEALRKRVLAAAEELSYSPNTHAQAMARGASNILGLIVHDIADPYFGAIASGVIAKADETGTVVLLANTGRDPEREVQYVAMLRAQRARAVIIAGSRWDDPEQQRRLSEQLQAYVAGGGRVSCISQNRLGTTTVLAENRAGAKALGRQLAEMGHRRFAVLAGPKRLLTARDRLQGFREGVREHGGEVVEVRHGPFTRDGGYETARDLLRSGTDATCLFAVNDVMAVGAMAACREEGVAVPDDLSVAGFDDIETLRDVAPALTTVRLPLVEMGERAASLALDGEDGPTIVRVKGEVILRDSTAAPRA